MVGASHYFYFTSKTPLLTNTTNNGQLRKEKPFSIPFNDVTTEKPSSFDIGG